MRVQSRNTRQAVFMHSESSSSSVHWAFGSDMLQTHLHEQYFCVLCLEGLSNQTWSFLH